jgi:hypothetical protein
VSDILPLKIVRLLLEVRVKFNPTAPLSN